MKTKILIVEDDIYLREGLCELLTKEGYEPASACNCKEGRRLFTEDNVDLIILDVMLPDGNGLDLCSFIRSTGADAPILFLAAHELTATLSVRLRVKSPSPTRTTTAMSTRKP